jgi:hypothetical protein
MSFINKVTKKQVLKNRSINSSVLTVLINIFKLSIFNTRLSVKSLTVYIKDQTWSLILFAYMFQTVFQNHHITPSHTL